MMFILALYARQTISKKNKNKKKVTCNCGYTRVLLYFMFTRHPDSCSKIIEIILLQRGRYSIIIFVINCAHVILKFYCIILHLWNLIFQKHSRVNTDFLSRLINCSAGIVGNVCIVFN